MNPIAEAMTGWSSAAAKGMPLDHVFRIIDEDTRTVPDHRSVLESQAIAELANHTALVGRQGTTVGIEDSAAPIRQAALIAKAPTATDAQKGWSHDVINGQVHGGVARRSAG